MDDHPVVLQQGVQALAISELRNEGEVVWVEGPGQSCVLWLFPQQQEGVQSELELPEIQSEKHGAEGGEDAAVYRHDRRFQTSGIAL